MPDVGDGGDRAERATTLLSAWPPRKTLAWRRGFGKYVYVYSSV